MEYSSTVRIDSSACPGVAYTLQKPSYGRVLAFDRENASFREKARKINRQSRELQDEAQAQKKSWTLAQEARRKDADAETAARIDAGFEYERLLDLAQRGATAEQRAEIVKSILALPVNREMFSMDPGILNKIRDLQEESDALVAAEYNPARLKWGIVSVEGLTIDGQPANAESILNAGPDDLLREILAKIDELASMTPEELRNFESPSTSSAAEPKADSITTAIAA